MIFTTLKFLVFFCVVFLAYYVVPKKVQWLVLLTASIYFYLCASVKYVIFVLAASLITYLGALILDKLENTQDTYLKANKENLSKEDKKAYKAKTEKKKKIVITLTVLGTLSMLLVMKYTGFALENISAIANVFNINFTTPAWNLILPLGISFYTFQQIAYIVATERGELENNDIIDYLAYILYFPKFIMGPIVDPVDYISQLNQDSRKRVDIINVTTGIKIFSLGLIKKVLLADTFAKAVLWAYTDVDALTAMECILLVLFYTFEIYFDFSGYSDMAVGVSSMFNIDLPMNFDSPYKAISFRDFWKRWHISLTKFLTKYIYIPLGGSRKGILFTYVNTLIVFLVSGLWHGASWTFVLWGLLHGLFSCLDRMFEKVEEKIFMPIRWLCTFGGVGVLWLLFSAQSVEQWKTIMVKILFMQSTDISDDMIASFELAENPFIYNMLGLDFFAKNIRGFSMLIFIFVACFVCFVPENNYRKKGNLNIGSLLLASVAFIWGILCLGAESTFVYFGF